MSALTMTYPELVANKDIIIEDHIDEVDMTAHNSGFFNIERFPNNEGNTLLYGELDRELYADDKPEGSQKKEGKIQYGFEKTLILEPYGKIFTETIEMKLQNKYRKFAQLLESVAKFIPERRELDLQHRIGFGTATSYVNKNGRTVDISTADEKALFATDHLLAASASTYRNILVNNPQFSGGALEGMEQMITDNSFNAYGQKVSRKFTHIWSTDDSNTGNEIARELRSTAGVADPNSGVTNVNKSKYIHVVFDKVNTDANGLPDTSKNKYWGLFASGRTDAHLRILVDNKIDMPNPKGNTYDMKVEAGDYGCYGNSGIVIVTGNGVTLSKGDNSA